MPCCDMSQLGFSSCDDHGESFPEERPKAGNGTITKFIFWTISLVLVGISVQTQLVFVLKKKKLSCPFFLFSFSSNQNQALCFSFFLHFRHFDLIAYCHSSLIDKHYILSSSTTTTSAAFSSDASLFPRVSHPVRRARERFCPFQSQIGGTFIPLGGPYRSEGFTGDRVPSGFTGELIGNRFINRCNGCFSLSPFPFSQLFFFFFFFHFLFII
jgi:hypothetical protein